MGEMSRGLTTTAGRQREAFSTECSLIIEAFTVPARVGRRVTCYDIWDRLSELELDMQVLLSDFRGSIGPDGVIKWNHWEARLNMLDQHFFIYLAEIGRAHV